MITNKEKAELVFNLVNTAMVTSAEWHARGESEIDVVSSTLGIAVGVAAGLLGSMMFGRLVEDYAFDSIASTMTVEIAKLARETHADMRSPSSAKN
jgi:ABC-type uncharacterized transport system permease subunit